MTPAATNYIIFVDEDSGKPVDGPVLMQAPGVADLWVTPDGREWEVVPGRRSYRKAIVPGTSEAVVTEVMVSAVGETPAGSDGQALPKRSSKLNSRVRSDRRNTGA
jgi:hypothetical protein